MAGIVRRVAPPELIAIPASLVCAIIAATGLPTRLGLSADDIATLLFSVFGFVATMRAYVQARRAGIPSEIPDPLSQAVAADAAMRLASRAKGDGQDVHSD